MHSIAPWETETVVTAWAKAAVRRDLHDAVDALDDARVRLIGLAEDTEWHSDGVRALHEKLADLQRRAAAIAGSLRLRQHEVDGVPIA